MPIPAGLSSCRRACVRSIANVSGFMPRRRAVAVGEVVDRADAGGAQSLALHRSHAGHEQQVAARDHLGVAGRAAPARDDVELAARVAPGDRRALARRASSSRSAMRAREPRAAELEHREEVVDLVHAHVPSPSSSSTRSARGDPEPIELVDVGRELHERGHPRAPRELRVLHDPAAGCPEPSRSRTRKSAKPTKSWVENAAW